MVAMYNGYDNEQYLVRLGMIQKHLFIAFNHNLVFALQSSQL